MSVGFSFSPLSFSYILTTIALAIATAMPVSILRPISRLSHYNVKDCYYDYFI
jgi:hypothetical protein